MPDWQTSPYDLTPLGAQYHVLTPPSLSSPSLSLATEAPVSDVDSICEPPYLIPLLPCEKLQLVPVSQPQAAQPIRRLAQRLTCHTPHLWAELFAISSFHLCFWLLTNPLISIRDHLDLQLQLNDDPHRQKWKEPTPSTDTDPKPNGRDRCHETNQIYGADRRLDHAANATDLLLAGIVYKSAGSIARWPINSSIASPNYSTFKVIFTYTKGSLSCVEEHQWQNNVWLSRHALARPHLASKDGDKYTLAGYGMLFLQSVDSGLFGDKYTLEVHGVPPILTES
ncbi:uncharacterized protein L3040_001488 [Drepanopeziza brunnea f. sp. 'multigermtubi']|uniref:uncharacterized protein n=1 Tax=Drepanopeziza brunnea f. sp. 'multigermtubi' TaxID=698441 RepID=UPI00239A48A4|nr:hypothetical protein L3040_001488 [Drepanopeziza brunnea f. sp. 'multigermtubi']